MKNLFQRLFAVLLVMSCNQEKSIQPKFTIYPSDEARDAIAKSNLCYWQAFVKGDSALFIDRYSTDACIMPPNAPAECGETAAQSFFRIAYTQMGIRNGKFITTEIYGNDEFLTEYGLFELLDSGNKLIDNGKYLVLWKKTGNGWKMFRDCFSSNNPPLTNNKRGN